MRVKFLSETSEAKTSTDFLKGISFSALMCKSKLNEIFKDAWTSEQEQYLLKQFFFFFTIMAARFQSSLGFLFLNDSAAVKRRVRR